MNAYFIWKNKNELTNLNAINQMKYDGEKKGSKWHKQTFLMTCIAGILLFNVIPNTSYSFDETN